MSETQSLSREVSQTSEAFTISKETMINQPSTFLTSVSCHEQSKALTKAMDLTHLAQQHPRQNRYTVLRITF